MKRIHPSEKQGYAIIQNLIALSPAQLEKLECEKLEDRINNVAKDMNINGWGVEKQDNSSISVIDVEKPYPITDEDTLDVEMTHVRFLTAVCDMEIPQEDTPANGDVIHFDDNTELNFVKQLLHDINLQENNTNHVVGAMIISVKTVPMLEAITYWGKMSYNLLKEMCELYIKVHE